jgi:Zn-dependent membrane protease YugP
MLIPGCARNDVLTHSAGDLRPRLRIHSLPDLVFMTDSPATSLSLTNVLRIIVGAMLVGVLVFAGVVIFKRQELVPLEFGASPLDYVVAGLVPVQLLVSQILPRQMLTANCRALAQRTSLHTPEAELGKQLQQPYLAAAIVGCALAEAACFLTLVVLMLGGPHLLWILVGVALLMLVVRFPLGDSVARNLQAWCEFVREEQQYFSREN